MSAPPLTGETLGGAGDRVKALLDERSATLARRRRVEAVVATRSVLMCSCGADRYGLLLGDVAQVVAARHCTRVPGASAAVLGLAAFSGRVVSVVALAAAMGRRSDSEAPETASGLPAGHFVVLRGAGAAFALAVDRVEGVVQIPAEASGPQVNREGAGLGSEAVSVYAAIGSSNEAIVLVDPRRLLRRYRA